jgi:hypothetical protein
VYIDERHGGVLSTCAMLKSRRGYIALERGVPRRLYRGLVGLVPCGGVRRARLAEGSGLRSLLLARHS